MNKNELSAAIAAKAGLTRKEAVVAVAAETGLPRRDVYDAVVAAKTALGPPPGTAPSR